MSLDAEGWTGASLPRRGGASLVRALSEAVDPHAILSRIVDQALALLPTAEGSAVEILDGDELVLVCASGSLVDHVGVRKPVLESLSGQGVLTGRILRCDDTAEDDRVDPEACRLIGARSLMCVPLVRPSGPVGVLTVASSERRSFSDRDMQMLSRLAEFITTTVVTASEFSRLVKRIVRDPDEPEPQSGLIDADDDDIAWFIANVIRPEVGPSVDVRRRIEGVLATGGFEILYQPIVELTTGRLIAAEALARFTSLPYRPPDQWFAEADRVGLGEALELAAVRAALAPLPFLPDEIRVTVNVGASTIGTDELAAIVEAAGPDRVVIELTEHLKVEDYPRLNARLGRLRTQRTLLAIDDTGAGISSLTHVLKLAPDVIKLDREITSGIDFDPVRRALTSALVTFARETGAMVVAEGIETSSELVALQHLGILYGQGFYLGRPAPSSALRHFGVDGALTGHVYN